jgi:alkyl sulfatase BDS1-like metallo-beta-lactamase superfamily hydrolase
VRHLAQQLPHRCTRTPWLNCTNRRQLSRNGNGLTITQLFDSLAIRIDGKRAWDSAASIRWHFSDTGETYRMELSNGVLTHHPTTRAKDADLAITLTKPQLLGMLAGAGTNGVQFDGDPKIFSMIASLTDQPDPNFAIVTP